MRNILLVGGGGYVGIELQKTLLDLGCFVRVFDTFWYSDGTWPKDNFPLEAKLEYVTGDVRNIEILAHCLVGIDTVIHLACISNDPSYELNPQIAYEINYLSFKAFIPLLNSSDVKHLIFASSSSVYGLKKKEEEVTENLSVNPLTDYSLFKVKCEEFISNHLSKEISYTILRPSTICGYSNRQRFDLVVNALTLNALRYKKIQVDGGEQFRPNLHIKDMLRAYTQIISVPIDKVHGEVFNIAGENLTVNEIASKVCDVVEDKIQIRSSGSVDNRSYRISGQKIYDKLGFTPLYSVEDAIADLIAAYNQGVFGDTTQDKYYNLKKMQALILNGELVAFNSL